MKEKLYAIFRLTTRPRSVFFILSILVVLLAVFSFYFYNKARNLENPNLATAAEIKSITSQIEKYFVLPKDETPTLATVSDPEKLRDQAFFAQAEKGDKVLIYTNSRRAILWRPSISKIIEVSIVNQSPLAPGSSNN